MKQNDKISRLETIVASLATQDPLLQTAAQPLIAELTSEVTEDVIAADNEPNADGHSPKMLRDWQHMQEVNMAVSGKSLEEVDAQLDAFFGAIERGELVDDGTGTWVPAK